MLIRGMLVQICSVFYFIFYFKSKGYGFKSSVNSVCTIKKLSHLSSLLQYCTLNYYLTKKTTFFFFAKIFSHRNSTTPSPIHYPSYAHAQCRNIEKSTPAPKLSCLCRSISILLVYGLDSKVVPEEYDWISYSHLNV